MVNFIGPRVKFTKDNGKMEDSMVKVNLPWKMERINRDYGLKVKK